MCRLCIYPLKTQQKVLLTSFLCLPKKELISYRPSLTCGKKRVGLFSSYCILNASVHSFCPHVEKQPQITSQNNGFGKQVKEQMSKLKALQTHLLICFPWN